MNLEEIIKNTSRLVTEPLRITLYRQGLQSVDNHIYEYIDKSLYAKVCNTVGRLYVSGSIHNFLSKKLNSYDFSKKSC